MKWTWQDVEDLARELAGCYPDEDPLRLSTKDVKKRVVSLPTFGDEPDSVTESILEDIQAAWYENREG
jgi:FeS assembly protein IscX